MKKFTRVEPTTYVTVGERYKRKITIKRFTTDDGTEHEFTTFGIAGETSGGVIALTTDNQVITTYQFRPGPERWMYELPGGGFNNDESPQDGAIRELHEETGYKPGTIEYLGESCRDAYSNHLWHYYLATDCVLAGESELDEEEALQGVEVKLITITELLEYAKTNQMSDPHAVLMAYDRLKELEDTHA